MLTLAAIAACLTLSILSRSSVVWTTILAVGAVSTIALNSNDLFHLVWFLDFTMLLVMTGQRQMLNNHWQTPTVALQILITSLYISNAVFAGAHPWLTYHVAYWANWVFLAQLLIVGSSGLGQSIRNYRYIRDQRRAGNNVPWLRTAWRMI